MQTDAKLPAAHTCPGRPDHPLVTHLREVAEKAAGFAKSFGSQDWAYLAGLWHDLGKYHPEFQDYLKQDSEANLENQESKRGKHRIDHSSAGALYLIDCFGTKGRILAYLIAGHHTGLLDWWEGANGKSPLSIRMTDEKQKTRLATILDAARTDTILEEAWPASSPPKGAGSDFGLSLWIRMLFSCLVDADFLDTEAYMNGGKTDIRATSYPSLESLRDRLDKHLKEKTGGAQDTELNRMRAEILEQCREKAMEDPGLFSLTVPTGGGKTLSSMAFALDHAIKHGKNRIIYVIPYTSIIEQNARVFKDIFGEENVIEHHSNFDSEWETQRSRLACENWDAPIIVTTNVQFFESLFAARTSRVRKIHNIVNSVVILDEAQLLAPEFLIPVLKAIEQLSLVYKTSLVFCTATQPALTRDNPALKKHGLERVREIIPDPKSLAARLERATIYPPADWNTKREWEDIAGQLQDHEQVLCIVNRRDDARDLFKILKGLGGTQGLYHLSALMCPAHRSRVIKEIKRRLENKEPTCVISTQLIEAGVDIDFPVVYRALAGLDSIAQAAGRCNREGKLGTKGGKVVVFIPPKPAPAGLLRKAEGSGKEVIDRASKNDQSFLAPDAFREYFQRFYSGVNSLDKTDILDDLKMGPGLECQFLTASRHFKLIDESTSAPVIVWEKSEKKEEKKEIETLLSALRGGTYERESLRKLQRHTVTIAKPWHTQLLKSGDIEEIIPGIFVQKHLQLYNHELGFVGNNDSHQMPENFIAWRGQK